MRPRLDGGKLALDVTAKTRALLLVVVTTLVGGILQQVFDPYQAARLYWMVGTFIAPLFFVFRWYVLDAEERAFRRSRRLDLAIVAIFLLAMPYYLFRS